MADGRWSCIVFPDMSIDDGPGEGEYAILVKFEVFVYKAEVSVLTGDLKTTSFVHLAIFAL